MRFIDFLFPILIIALLIAIIIFAIPKSCLPEDFIGGSDSGDVGVNVTTGKVKVDITDTDGNSVVGKVLRFAGEADGNEVRFIPGISFHTEGFKVKNAGDVKINYRMYVSRQEGVDMQKFDEAFEFYVTTDPLAENKEQLISFDGTLTALQSSETYYLVIKMKESAGNEFQNKTFTGIGITVNATQVAE